MYKALCVAVLLLPTFVLGQGSKPASASATTFTSPQIVAKGKLSNQTAPIPTTTIFTPVQSGLYRLSAYATMSKADPNSRSYWNYSVNWTDDAGAQNQSQLLIGYGSILGPFYYLSIAPPGGTSMPFEAKAGTPITYSMSQGNVSDNSAYSLYYTLERLE